MSLSTLHEQLRALRLGHFSQALQQQQAQRFHHQRLLDLEKVKSLP